MQSSNLPTGTEIPVNELPKQVPPLPAPKRALLWVIIGICIVILSILGAYLLYKNIWTNKKETQQSAAVVDGISISKENYNNRLSAQKYFYQNIEKQEVSNLETAVLEDLIKEALLTKFLKEHDIEVTDQEVRTRIQKITLDPNWDGDWAKYEKALKNQYKTSLPQVMTTYRLQILTEKVKSLKTKKHLFIIWIAKTKVPFTPQEEPAAFETNKPKLLAAQNILARIMSGEDFSKLATEVSEHKLTRDKGGDAGIFIIPPVITKPDLYPATKPVLEALETLRKGESNIFEYWTGYLIAKVSDVEEGIGSESFDEWFKKLRKNANVSVLIKTP